MTLKYLWNFVGASGFIAVLMGAAAAHWLSATLPNADIARIEKAATYQIYHTLALLGIAVYLSNNGGAVRSLNRAASCFIIGIILFCGSLYAYSFLHWHWLVFITPLGGLSFMAGWLMVAWGGKEISAQQSLK